MAAAYRFDAYHLHTRNAMSSFIDARPGKEPCVVADLTLGAWTPHTIASQWLGQILGKEVSYRGGSPAEVPTPEEAMYAAVDDESKGNRAVLNAISTARQIIRITSRHPAFLVILVPCFGIPWRADDILLIEYIRELAPNIKLSLGIAGDTPSPWPQCWTVLERGDVTLPGDGKSVTLLDKLPSAISPSLLARFPRDASRSLIPLRAGWGLVAPERRQNPSTSLSATDIEEITEKGLNQFKSFGVFHCSESNSDGWTLSIEAWRQMHVGYRDLALRYIELAAQRNGGAQPFLYSFKQAMRIGLGRYCEAAAEAEPAGDFSQEIRGALYEFKGWGLVMSGAPEAALPYLREAMTLCKSDTVNRAYLFLMNITALAEFRCGFFENALHLEKRIEGFTLSSDEMRDELRFINSINMARLYRSSKDYDLSEIYYDKAFSTIRGAYTDTEYVNEGLCLAHLDEERGALYRCLERWVRSAMQWCASNCPEALSWRVQGMLIGESKLADLQGVGEAVKLVESVAAAFLEKLKRLSAQCGVLPSELALDSRPKRFLSTDCDFSELAPLRYLQGGGWSVIAARGRCDERHYGKNWDELILWLNGWIALSAGVGDEDCFLIDRLNGNDMPATFRDLIGSAAEFGIAEINIDGDTQRLTDAALTEIRCAREAHIGPQVSWIDENETAMTVYFRRYTGAYRLSDEERVVLTRLRAHPGIVKATSDLRAAGILADRTESIIAALRRRRILQLSVGNRAGSFAEFRIKA